MAAVKTPPADMRHGEARCPYGPCRAIPNVTTYLAQPGDVQPTLPIIDPHPLDAEHALSGEQCPAGLMRLPINAHGRATLARSRMAYLRRAEAAARKPKGGAPKGGASGIPEHSLTPHPDEKNQWFVSGPERGAHAMPSIPEVAAQIDHASLLMAEAQSMVFQAAAKVTEAREVLGAVIGHVDAPLGLLACAAASDALDTAHTSLHSGIEQNALYRGSL